MCLAVYKPAGVRPDWEAYANGFQRNPHGSGFAVVSDGQLKIHKGFFTFDDFRAALEPYAAKQCAIHFRLATHGKTDIANCHPFVVSRQLAVIHNGILPIDCNVNSAMSDTWHYTTLILKPLAERDADFYKRPEMSFIGSAAIEGSKLVFLRSDGDYHIWNEGDGHWHADAWWSNKSYEGYQRTLHKPVTRFLRDDWWQPDEPESKYRDYLKGESRWAYEDLLRDGFSVEELDQLIDEGGEEELRAVAEEFSGGES